MRGGGKGRGARGKVEGREEVEGNGGRIGRVKTGCRREIDRFEGEGKRSLLHPARRRGGGGGSALATEGRGGRKEEELQPQQEEEGGH